MERSNNETNVITVSRFCEAILYTIKSDVSKQACGALLTQDHNGTQICIKIFHQEEYDFTVEYLTRNDHVAENINKKKTSTLTNQLWKLLQEKIK